MNGQAAVLAYPVAMGGTGGNPPGRVRPRGNIETLASGSLRVRMYAGVDVLTGRDLYLKHTIPAGPQARQRAEDKLAEFIEQVEQRRQPRTNASLQLLIQRQLDASDVEPRTKASLLGYLNKHIAPLIGDQPIGAIDAEVLEGFYATLRRCREHCDGRSMVVHYTADGHRCRKHQCKPLAAWTIRKIHYLISGAYQTANRWKWISVNPTSEARKPAPPGPDPQPPTAEEAAALVNESWRRGFGAFVWVAMTTGARRGELCALRWRDLQVNHTEHAEHDCVAARCAYTLVIRRAVCQGNGGQWWESDTKTHQRRHIALDPETVAVLMDHRQRCERDAEQLGLTLSNNHRIFAAAPDGTTCKPSSISQRYRRCAQHLGIDTTLKCLRHYSATELITAGVDIRTVAGRLGHGGGGTTTLKVYAAWVAAADQHASDVLMRRMPPRPNAPVDPEDRAKLDPRWPHEQVAAQLHRDWLRGALQAGSELTVKDIARTHAVSVGTAHRVITLLRQWGVVQVHNGRRNLVLARPTDTAMPDAAPGSAPDSQTQITVPDHQPSATGTDADRPVPRQLTLHLRQMGASIRTLSVQADPTNFDTLQQLLLDAVRRTGGDRTRIGDYEMAVHLAGHSDPITTVVIAA